MVGPKGARGPRGAVTVAKTLGVVIGERRLTMKGARAKGVTVRLGTPRLPKGEQDWECPFQITGGGLRIFEFGYGCDAIQAIQTALGGIRYFLEKSSKSFEWFDLGLEVAFPRVIPSYGDTRLTKKLEKLVDAELTRNLTRPRRRDGRATKKA